MATRQDSIGRKITKRGEPIRFIESAVHSDTDQCILWPYAKDEIGYGKIIINKKKYRAHRLVLTLCKGPNELDVLHGCLNKSCVNPRHLRFGTEKENIEDARKDGTLAIGSKIGCSKLKEEQIPTILEDKRTLREIAKDYGVDHKTIHRIKSGQGWLHAGLNSKELSYV